MTDVNLRHGIFLGPHHPVDEDPTYLIHRDLELMDCVSQIACADVGLARWRSCFSTARMP